MCPPIPFAQDLAAQTLYRYHWAFLVSSKKETDVGGKATRYHATDKLLTRDGELKPTWQYEQGHAPDAERAKLLALVFIGKVVKPREQLEASLKKVPIVQDVRCMS